MEHWRRRFQKDISFLFELAVWTLKQFIHMSFYIIFFGPFVGHFWAIFKVYRIRNSHSGIVSNLINTLLKEDRSYGERKGAAYGIAGIVKGLGILSLKQLDIMGRLTEAIQGGPTGFNTRNRSIPYAV